ncbi:MAG: hypothetical protein LBE78_01865 [Burkholderiaceae bacterium]|jgi:hypothetical protein|nr:hypothetical protein [Burkholderiaceae bacterium]
MMATFLMHFGLGGVIGLLVMLGVALTWPSLLWGEAGERIHKFLYGPRDKPEQEHEDDACEEAGEPISEDDVAELSRLWTAIREQLGRDREDWRAESVQMLLRVMAAELRAGEQEAVQGKVRGLYGLANTLRDEEARRQLMRNLDEKQLKLIEAVLHAMSVALETGREDVAFRMAQELDWLTDGELTDGE